MNNQDILFASLVGVKNIATHDNLKLVQGNISTVKPNVNFQAFKENGKAVSSQSFPEQSNVWQATPVLSKDKQFSPLSFSIDGENWFTLPYEPLISLSGKNKVIRRSVAKWSSENSKNVKGTIKERWAEDDSEITITGVLIGQLMQGKYEDCYPIEDFIKLYEVMTTSNEIRISCPMLELQGINKIVIEDYSFPFTKGENVQAYEIKAYSDYSYNLLLEL